MRALGHVVTREKAAIGVLISLYEATDKMRADAASAGFYTHKVNGQQYRAMLTAEQLEGFYTHKVNGQQYPKLQLVTVGELLDGHGIARPSSSAATDETFKRAPKAKAKGGVQGRLL